MRVRRVAFIIIAILLLAGSAVLGRFLGSDRFSGKPGEVELSPELSVAQLQSPRSLGELLVSMNAALADAGVNALASTRIVAYAAVAYHDAALNRPPLVASEPLGSRSPEDGLAAAAAVYRGLVSTRSLLDISERWPGPPGPVAVSVADAVLAAAGADGFESAASASTSWVSPPPHHDPALEPGWGTLRPLLTDRARCRVPPPPPERRDQLDGAVGALQGTISNTAAGNPMIRARGFFAYPGLNAPPGVLANPSSALLSGFAALPDAELLIVAASVAAFDVSVVAAAAIWEDPQPGPLELVLHADTTLWGTDLDGGFAPLLLATLPLPAYPSLDAATVAASGSMFDALSPGPVEVRGLVSSMRAATGSELVSELTAAGAGVFYVDVDVDAGVMLGTCVAAEVLDALNQPQPREALGG